MRIVTTLSLFLLVGGMAAWPALGVPWSPATGKAGALEPTGLERSAPVRIAAAKGKKKAAPKSVPKQKQQQQDHKDEGRTPFTTEDEVAAAIPGIPDARVWGDSDADFQRLLPSANGPWLALSGGGADGAYSAGLINGWTQSGNRPEFSLVSGVSIGALIAPYVFLGSNYDQQLRDALTTITAADVFEDNATRESLLDSWPLKKLIEKRVTPELLAEVAAEHKKGRRLLVTTTNMDAGRRVVWNMGAIAARGDDKALGLFRNILLASSSIPGFFPPVGIEVEANGKTFEEMHLDGTITAPFFVAPEATLAPGGSGLPTKQVYVMVNSKLKSDFLMPEHNTVSVLGRTIGVALVTGLRTELLLMTEAAQRLGFTLNVAHVPETFSVKNRTLFDEKYMGALFDLGVEQAKSGAAFESIAPNSGDLRTSTPQ